MAAPNKPGKPSKSVFNPAVKEAIAALRAENTPQNLNAAVNQLVRSPLLVPGSIRLPPNAPKPEKAGAAPLPPNSKVTLAMVKSPEGKLYNIAFSDWQAAAKWKPQNGQKMLVLPYDAFVGLLLQNTASSGLVVNPFTESLRLERPLIESVKKQRAEMAARAKQAPSGAVRINPGDKITLVEPTVIPDGLADPVCELLKDVPGVSAAYLQVMIVNDSAKSYLLVLDGPKDDALFASIAKAIHPYLSSREKKIDVTMTVSVTPLGQQGMRGSEPFYRKGIGRIYDTDDEDDDDGADSENA